MCPSVVLRGCFKVPLMTFILNLHVAIVIKLICALWSCQLSIHFFKNHPNGVTVYEDYLNTAGWKRDSVFSVSTPAAGHRALLISTATMLDHFLLDESNKFGNKTRFVILFLCVISFMMLTCNNLAYSMTVICMDDLANNNTDHWLYSPSQRNALFSAVSVGSLMGTIPFMTFLRYIGMR